MRQRKREARRLGLARRAALPCDLRRCLSALAVMHLRGLPEYCRAGTVLAFAAFGDELDTLPLLRGILADGKRLVLPVTDPAERRLVLRGVTDLSQLEPGTWGIPEPRAECPSVPGTDMDLIVLPGVLFDDHGGRVGYGGGYYDGLLRRLRRQLGSARMLSAWGLALEVQVVPGVSGVPAGSDDENVDGLVTDAGIRRFAQPEVRL